MFRAEEIEQQEKEREEKYNELDERCMERCKSRWKADPDEIYEHKIHYIKGVIEELGRNMLKTRTTLRSEGPTHCKV